MNIAVSGDQSILPNEKRDQPLDTLHTMRMMVWARYYWPIFDEQHLWDHQYQLMQRAKEAPIYYLGQGSNTVFMRNFKGLIVHLCTRGIEKLFENDQEVRIKVAAGENWHQWVEYCVTKGWYGVENLVLIPGTVGAAPVQNIGAFGVEVAQVVESIMIWDCQSGEYFTLSKDDCQFAYRSSIFQRQSQWLIISIVFRLNKHFSANLTYQPLAQWWDEQIIQRNSVPSARDLVNHIIEIRKSRLPDSKLLANSGSFFCNPVIDAQQHKHLCHDYPDLPTYPTADGRYKLAAAWMIDYLGLKGFSVGDMAVHQNQALVLVNKGRGTPTQLLYLVKIIQQAVFSHFGVKFHTEPNLV